MKKNICVLCFLGALSACNGSSTDGYLIELDPQTILLTKGVAVHGTQVEALDTDANGGGEHRTDLAPFEAVGVGGFEPASPVTPFQSTAALQENGLSVTLAADIGHDLENTINVTVKRTDVSVLPVKGNAMLAGTVAGFRTFAAQDGPSAIATLSADATLYIDFADARISGQINNTVLHDPNGQQILASNLEDIPLPSTPLRANGSFLGDHSFINNMTYAGLLGGNDGRAAALTFTRSGADFQDYGVALLSE